MSKSGFTKPKKLLAQIKKEESKAKMKIKKIRCKCNHQDHKDNLWVYPLRKGGRKNTCKCDECSRKIDLSWMAEKDRDEIRQYIKTVFKEPINVIDGMKLQLSASKDGEILKFFGDVQYGLERIYPLIKAAIVDQLEPHKKKGRKKKGKNKKKKRGIRLGSAGRSLGFGKKR